MDKRVLSLPVLLIALALTWGQVQGAQTFFYYQFGTPTGIPNFVQPASGCAWTGLGGQVFDLQGQPVVGVVVRVTGTLGGAPVDAAVLSGSSVKFGPGGYEVELAKKAVASNGSLHIQLIDLSGAPLSPALALQTAADCGSNLQVVNWRKVTMSHWMFFPTVRRK
jgi:hypothetical protein